MGIPTPNYREAGQLLSAYGQRLGMEGDDAGAQQALTNAITIAQHEGDLPLEMETLLAAAWVDVTHLRLEESGKKGLQVLELMDRLDGPQQENEALLRGTAVGFLLRVNYCTGNLVEARRYATIYQEIMEKLGNRDLLVSALYCNEKIAALGGDWTSARQFCDRAMIQNPQHEMLLLVRALLEYAVGEVNQGEAFLERLIEVFHKAGPEPGWLHVTVPQAVSAVAQMTGTTKHIDVAQAAAKTVLSSQQVSPLFVWFARTGLALLAAQVGDTATVQEQYHALRGQRGNFMTMDVDRVLGLLAAASGEMDEAAAYFEAALATWSKGRYPEYARTAYDYADMLLRRQKPVDEARANTLLGDALSISRELGMKPLTEKVLLRMPRTNSQ